MKIMVEVTSAELYEHDVGAVEDAVRQALKRGKFRLRRPRVDVHAFVPRGQGRP